MVASVVSSIMIGLIRWTPLQQKYFGDNDFEIPFETCSYINFHKCAACASSPCSLSPWCHGWRLPPTQLKALKLFPGTFSHFLLQNISLQFLSLPLDKWSLLSGKWSFRQNGTGVFPPQLLQSQEGNGKGETSHLILLLFFCTTYISNRIPPPEGAHHNGGDDLCQLKFPFALQMGESISFKICMICVCTTLLDLS